jgi:hypothetical protein
LIIELEDGDRFIYTLTDPFISFDKLCSKIKDDYYLDLEVEFVMYTAPPIVVITNMN